MKININVMMSINEGEETYVIIKDLNSAEKHTYIYKGEFCISDIIDVFGGLAKKIIK